MIPENHRPWATFFLLAQAGGYGLAETGGTAMIFQMLGRCFNHPMAAGYAEAKQSYFTVMYDEFHQMILRYTRRMVGEQDAEGIAQTVFEKIHRKLSYYIGEAGIATCT